MLWVETHVSLNKEAPGPTAVVVGLGADVRTTTGAGTTCRRRRRPTAAQEARADSVFGLNQEDRADFERVLWLEVRAATAEHEYREPSRRAGGDRGAEAAERSGPANSRVSRRPRSRAADGTVWPAVAVLAPLVSAAAAAVLLVVAYGLRLAACFGLWTPASSQGRRHALLERGVPPYPRRQLLESPDRQTPGAGAGP